MLYKSHILNFLSTVFSLSQVYRGKYLQYFTNKIRYKAENMFLCSCLRFVLTWEILIIEINSQDSFVYVAQTH